MADSNDDQQWDSDGNSEPVFPLISPSQVLDLSQLPKAQAVDELIHHVFCQQEEIIDEGGAYLEFSGLSQDVVERFYPQQCGVRDHATYFGEESGGRLFIKMAGPVHRMATRAIMDELWDGLVGMGLDGEIKRTLNDRFHGNGSAVKQPDDALVPTKVRASSNSFPTLVVEAGGSQFPERMREAKN